MLSGLVEEEKMRIKKKKKFTKKSKRKKRKKGRKKERIENGVRQLLIANT